MKFGDSFHRRSIPEWSTHNVDYNDLKDLIKRRTTKNNGEAQPIPGTQNEASALQRFEDELYTQLKDQHARVDLFVRSKLGEYSRKLTHLQRQITTLERQSFPLGQTKISVRQLEKFSKLEDQTLKTGSDVQCLVQFANANRLALYKLLKKYKKWTSSSMLGQRFRRDVLNSTSSLNSNFEPLVKQYVDTLASVREPFDTGVNLQAKPEVLSSPKSGVKVAQSPTALNNGTRKTPTSTADEIQAINQSGTRAELDTALATVPLGQAGSRAVYWVHPDYVVQLQILLLQYTRIRSWSKSPTSSRSTTNPRPSRRGSVSGQANDCLNTGGHESGLIACDNLDSYVARQSGEPIGNAETLVGTVAEKAIASVRYSSDKDVLVAVTTASTSSEMRKQRGFQQMKIKRKSTRRLFDPSGDEEGALKDSSDDYEKCRLWLEKNPQIRPLVHIHCKRSHFVGVRNSETAGIWVTLETDVVMRNCQTESMSRKDRDLLSFSGEEGSELLRFSLGVLEVRVEGPEASGLADVLDASHLVTRIRGFSLETHAIAIACRPQGMRPPIWFPRLEEDMRKLPSSSRTNGRSQGKKISPEQPSKRYTYISTPSTNDGKSSTFSPAQEESSATSVPGELVNPPLSAFKKKRKTPKRRRLPVKELKASQPPSQRYWNEFDDGSEGEQDEPYTIFVDPNASSTFPGAETASEVFSHLSSNSKESWKKFRVWITFQSQDESFPGERSPLFKNHHSGNSPTIDDSSDSENETASIKQGNYATIASNNHHYVRSARETMLFRGSLLGFATSFIFVVVAAILVATGHKKTAAEINVGALICVVASAVFAFIGIGCMLTRHDRVGWVHRAAVTLTLFLVILANAGVLLGLRHV